MPIETISLGAERTRSEASRSLAGSHPPRGRQPQAPATEQQPFAHLRRGPGPSPAETRGPQTARAAGSDPTPASPTRELPQTASRTLLGAISSSVDAFITGLLSLLGGLPESPPAPPEQEAGTPTPEPVNAAPGSYATSVRSQLGQRIDATA